MKTLYAIYAWIDPLLIFFYRLPENPVAGFFLGTFFLCLLCVIIGEITIIIMYRFNRNYYRKLKQETVRMHNLSIKAILAKDKESYGACNRQANEAFGRYFFAQLGLGASSLWALPFALGWMSQRFHDVSLELFFTFPGIGNAMGYIPIFILSYILVRIFFGKLKPLLPWMYRFDFRREINNDDEKMVSWTEVERHGGFPDR
jgi:hypothetical protein